MKAPRALADSNIDVAQHAARLIARKYGGESGEYLSAAYLGLVQAARTFRPRRHDNFKKFALQRCIGQIRDERRTQGGFRRRKRVKVERLNGDEFLSVQPLPSMAEAQDEVERIAKMAMLDKRPTGTHGRKPANRERQALVRMLADGKDFHAACRELGMSDSWGWSVKADLRAKLQRKAVA